jgi:threonine synthase
LAIGNPAAGPYALETLAETGGSGVLAYEDEIVEGMKILAETEGIFTETAGGVVVAGLRRLVSQGKIKSEDLTVAFITGNGLKVQELVDDLVNPINIKPTYDSFQREMTNYSSNNGS